MSVRAKICGLSTPETVKAAFDGGAAFLGFVFFDKSPRNLAPETAARGHFVHVYVDRATQRPVPLPEPLKKVLEALR